MKTHDYVKKFKEIDNKNKMALLGVILIIIGIIRKLLIFAGIVLIGLYFYLLYKKQIEERKEQEEKKDEKID